MISRRILRIKVMQVLFTYELSEKEDSGGLEKMLMSRIDKTKQLYYVYLQYLIEVCQYVLVDAARRENKYIKDQEDLNINTQLASNSCISAVQQSEAYKSILKKYSLSHYIDNKLVRDLFHALEASQKYVNYCEIAKPSRGDEVEILRYIAKKIIGTSADLDEHLAERFMNLEDDHFISLHTLQKKLKDFVELDKEAFIEDFLNNLEQNDEINFSKELISNYLSNRESLEKIIEPRLKNWDMDRVALMDIILIKLAIVEFLHFPYIPLKVSMNEYIDISKEYSTEKSKDFINGILDKTMKGLNDGGKIKKLGRGLINN